MTTLEELKAERKRIDAEIRRLTTEAISCGRIKVYPQYGVWHLAIKLSGTDTSRYKEVSQFPKKTDAISAVNDLFDELVEFQQELKKHGVYDEAGVPYESEHE